MRPISAAADRPDPARRDREIRDVRERERPVNSPPVLLSDLDPENVSRELKKEGSDWFAVWSSQNKKLLDVTLVHTLSHET